MTSAAHDVLAVSIAEELQVLITDHAAIKYPDPSSLAMVGLHGLDDLLERFRIVSVAFEDLIRHRQSFARDDQADAYLFAVWTFVA